MKFAVVVRQLRALAKAFCSCSPALGRQRSEQHLLFFAAMLRSDEIVARVVLDGGS
jgi:hypothetical protein